MKSVIYRSYGGPEVLETAELPEPKINIDSVLVRVKAAGVNPADLGNRAGVTAENVETYFPVIPGWDISGVVERAGIGAPEFAPGDEVVGYLREAAQYRHGGYAELVAANVSALAPKPRGLSWEEAAALPLAGLTAYQAVVHVLEVSAGETLLVHGAAGGVGSLAAQLARSRGATVIGTASPRNHGYLRSLGVTPVSHGPHMPDQVRESAPGGVSRVLDAAGYDSLSSTPRVARPGARVASIADFGRPDTAAVFVRLDPGDFRALVALAEEGHARPRIGAVYPLEEAAEAHRDLAEGRTAGRIVLKPA